MSATERMRVESIANLFPSTTGMDEDAFLSLLRSAVRLRSRASGAAIAFVCDKLNLPDIISSYFSFF